VLKLSTQTVARLERDGELEGTRVGGSLRFSAEAVEALLKRGSKQ
jgi:excisionase family DNA binding protein